MKALIYIIILLTSAIWFTSCRGIKYVPVETVRIEYKDRIIKDSSSTQENKSVRDSVRYRDSVVTIVDENGNVLRTEIYKWRDRFRESNYLLNQLQTRFDSLYTAKQDSIQVPYPVEKQLNRWKQMKIELGGWAFGAIIVFVLLAIGGLVNKKFKH